MPTSGRLGTRGTVAILHAHIPPTAPPDEQDTLVQAGAVAAALRRLGYAPVPVPVTRDLEAMRRRLAELRPVCAFNLVEALDGKNALLHVVPEVLERDGMNFTGAGSAALRATTDKLAAKAMMRAAGLSTPDWIAPGDDPRAVRGRYIVKPVAEDASIGIDTGAVVDGGAAIARRLAEMTARHGGTWFAEKFVDGREFHAAAIAESGAIRVLPVCEIDYRNFPAEALRILDYAAKWQPGSYQYEGHEYEFNIPESDGSLVRRIEALTDSCWRLFRLGGYARVDFRVDAAGEAWVLEVNANPCLTEVCNFSDMLTRAGIAFDRAIETIVAEAVGSTPVRRAAAR